MQHVVMFSAGAGSWAAAKRVAERVGLDRLQLLFTDTLMEDPDAYRFLIEGAANVFGISLSGRMKVPSYSEFPDFRDRPKWKRYLERLSTEAVATIPQLVWLKDGRDIWEVFFDERFLGNSRLDPCSKILKRRAADRWLVENCDPRDTVCYVGIDFTEAHRFDDGRGGGLRPRRALEGWTYEAPLCSEPWLAKWDVIEWMRAERIAPPRLYALGFSHNNCFGFCIKAGHAHYRLLLQTLPDVYSYHEQKEQEIREYLGKDVSILADRRHGNKKRPLTLRAFRMRATSEHASSSEDSDYGGCGCFIDQTASTE
ncbi:hypothetical protein [Bradyrhizobium sp. 164]|uniref:hypothetical protein n=1 Tax=Bradyrhizobium sp. 164 TaxID=2782637 RepID=UPI001FFAF214|nr:hypothetical protein [Bradyrhizobium sp. 164]MCK1593341.1 hypothetical protein [Bradyrhizobium sp. 164]